MKKIILTLWLLISLSSEASAQAVQNSPPVTARAETTLSKTVVRIIGTVEGIESPINGTGFIVVLPVQGLPGNHFIGYLVTNRHVAEAITVDSTGHRIKHRILNMAAIVNLKTPINGTKVHAISLPPEGPEIWHFPTDEAIDLAVIAFHLDDTYDIT